MQNTSITNMKILVIDDISVNIDTIRSILNVYMPEYEIISAQSGSLGLELAHNELPEIVLLDYLMPKMNGFEVCAKLRESEVTSNIPVLMVSALGDNSKVRTEALNAGADAFISKPFDIREFVALVKVMLRIKNAEDLLRKRNEELEVIIKKQTRHYLDSEERFFQISKHVREFFWEVDQNLIFTFLSKSTESILGHNFSGLLGKTHLYNLTQNTENGSGKNEIIKTVKEKKEFIDKEFSFVTKNENIVWLSINGFPIYDNDNNFAGYRGVCDDITRRKQAEEQLNKSVEEIKKYQTRLKKLNCELTYAEEKEKKRIAEYLHDGIGQTLALAFMNLSAISQLELSDDIQKSIKYSTRLINSAISETHLLTYDLSPPILYELGFLSAVKWKLDQVEEKFDIETEFNDHGIKMDLNAETSISVYRIICELIANTIKHANASKLTIEIDKTAKHFLIEVADNGLGFSTLKLEKNEDTNTYGFFSIKERLDAISGLLKIDSTPGKGTRSEVFVPYPDNE